MPAVTQEQIASHVAKAFEITGAVRTDLLRTAMNSWAPHPVIEVLLTLPEGYYRNLAEVWQRLPDLPER